MVETDCAHIKRFIFCPVVNNFHLLEKAIRSVPLNVYDEYFIFNNSGKSLPIECVGWKIINDTRKTFLETQNIMRQYAIDNKYHWYSFMHNDAEVKDDTVERLVKCADRLCSSQTKWATIFTHYDVLCAYSTECVNDIGVWGDDYWCKNQLNGYFLDNDYYNRMRLSTYTVYQLENTHVLHNEPSNTIKDPTEGNLWSNVVREVETYYKSKWDSIEIPYDNVLIKE